MRKYSASNENGNNGKKYREINPDYPIFIFLRSNI